MEHCRGNETFCEIAPQDELWLWDGVEAPEGFYQGAWADNWIGSVDSTVFNAVVFVLVVLFIIIRSSNKRGFVLSENGYATTIGLILWISTLYHMIYGEMSVFNYNWDVIGIFDFGETPDERNLGWDAPIINTYEITVAGTFLVFGRFVPSLLGYSVGNDPGPAMTWLIFTSNLFIAFYAFPLIFFMLGPPAWLISYFVLIDTFALIALAPFVWNFFFTWWD